ncbi:MAG: hypothetical protein AB7U35_13850 [Sphingobium sp.]
MIEAPNITRMLPGGFEELERFVDKWAVDTTAMRIDVRSTSTMSEIRDFYDAMVPRAAEAMALIDQNSLHDLPEDLATLCKLVLALAGAATAIEIHGEPTAPGSPYPSGIKLVRGTQPFG